MKNTELENLRKMSATELLAQKTVLEKSVIFEIAKIAPEGKKNSKKINDEKKKIARVETLITEKLLMEAK